MALKTHNNGKRGKGRPFGPGNPGRPKGAQNHLTKTVKETVLNVFNDIQQDPKLNLRAFAKDHTRDFYQIAAKLIPTEIAGSFTKIQVEIVRNNTGLKTEPGPATSQTGTSTEGSQEV